MHDLMNNDDSIGSVTHLLRQLQIGEATDAQQEIWELYFQRLAGFARMKLAAGVRRTADEEDVAPECAEQFFQGRGERTLSHTQRSHGTLAITGVYRQPSCIEAEPARISEETGCRSRAW